MGPCGSRLEPEFEGGKQDPIIIYQKEAEEKAKQELEKQKQKAKEELERQKKEAKKKLEEEAKKKLKGFFK